MWIFVYKKKRYGTEQEWIQDIQKSIWQTTQDYCTQKSNLSRI